MRHLLCLFLFCSTAHANLLPYTPKTFTARVICGGGVECARAVHVFELSSTYIDSAVKVRLKLIDAVDIKEEMTGDPHEQLLKWALRTSDLPAVDVTIFALASYSPLSDHIDAESEGILGLASGIGVIGKEPCGAFSRIVGSDKLAAKVMTHEIGHLLGAHHIASGLMFPSMDIGQYMDAYSSESIREIETHLASLP